MTKKRCVGTQNSVFAVCAHTIIDVYQIITLFIHFSY